jgi:hypothetical protein
MAKVQAALTNFTGGEFSPRLYGRSDVQKYRNAAKTIENFIIVPHGGARKRSGTKFVVEVKSSSDTSHRLVPFQYNTEQAYVLLFGPSYIWFIKDQGIITETTQGVTGITNTNPAVLTYAGSDTFANGDKVYITGVGGMHQVNNRHHTVANVNTGANSFELSGVDATGYGTYTSGGTIGEIVELATPFTADELSDLDFAQSADTLYISHPSHHPTKLQRSSHTAWTLTEVVFEKGPFRTINANEEIILTPSAFSGSATGYGTQQVGQTFTLTATGGTPFTSGHVGSLWRLNESSDGETGIASATVGDSSKNINNNDTYTTDGNVYGVTNVNGTGTWEKFTRVPKHKSGRVRIYGGTGTSVYFDSDYLHNGWCVIEITAFTSSTVVTAEIVYNQMPSSIATSGTSFWEEGSFSGERGFPRGITFFEQRLMFAGTESEPNTVWGSRSAAFEDFEDGPDDDDAITFTIASGTVDIILWISGGRVLSVGTPAGEFSIASTSNNEALTPSNVRAIPQTSLGSSKAKPIRIGQVLLFTQRAGDPDNYGIKIREYAYRYEADSFASADLTIFSQHVTGEGIIQLAYQSDPESVIWGIRSDGALAACTYEREQEVVAWHRQVLGGTSAAVEQVCVIPGAQGDEPYYLASRTINGGTKRYIEFLTKPIGDTDDKEDGVYLDCSVTYLGAATSTITGLHYLEGQTVDVLNYGSVEKGKVVTNASITLTNPATLNQPVHIGLPYTSILNSLDLDAGAQAGTAMSRSRRISQVYARLQRSLGGTVGYDESKQDDILYRAPEAPMGASPPLFSGLKEVDFYGGHEKEMFIRFEHDDPLPFFVTAVVAEMQTQG